MPRPNDGAMTLEDVARRAGVSRATASRVLAGSPLVSPAAREQVTRAAAELHYLPNPMARALASGWAGAPGTRIVVGVVSPRPGPLIDDYLGQVVAAAAAECAPAGVGVGLQGLAPGGPGPLAALAADRTVLGVLLVNTTVGTLRAIPPQLAGRVVSIGIGSVDVPSVDVDNRAGGAAIVRHLYDSGRRRIAMIAGPAWLPCVRRPLTAYADVMRAAGLPVRAVRGDFSSASGRVAADLAIRRWPDTDAIFAICDTTALGALAALHDRGIEVPGDVAVAGFDDLPFAELSSPPLTTATHPTGEIAAAATRLVLAGARDRPADRAFPSELVLRRSA